MNSLQTWKKGILWLVVIEEEEVDADGGIFV